MCSSVNLMLLLLAQLPSCFSSDGHCSELQKLYLPNSTDMVMLGRKQDVATTVIGSGGGARAAAALLLVAIHHVKGYQARLNTTFVHLCDLLKITNTSQMALVAPAVPLTQEKCPNQGSVVLLTNVARPAAVSYELLLWAYVVPSESCSKLKAVQWSFYTDYHKVQECGFKTSKTIIPNSRGYPYFAVLARNESSNDNEIVTELQRRFQARNLQLQIECFKSDFLMRKEIAELKNHRKTFLFLDENLWSDAKHVINVQLPPSLSESDSCTTCTSVGAFRIGNGQFMSTFAPKISKLVNNLSPNASQLRQILEIETAQNQSHIVDAACKWALKYDKDFQNMISYNSAEDRSVFDIKIILCDSDPLNPVFKNLTDIINTKILKETFPNINFRISSKIVYCYEEDSLKRVMTKIIQETTIAGVISWSTSEGTESAAKIAEEGYLPLMLAGPVDPKVQLSHAVHAVTGQLTNLIRAIHYLLDSCEWSRIAILSDKSAFSKSFVVTLDKQKKLLYRNDIINSTTFDVHLDELEKADARIFLLNVNWSISCQILCAALKRGMTPTNGFVWIARDWRPLEYCDNYTWDGMYHYTLHFGWQGEHVESGLKYLQDELRNLSSKESITNSDPLILAQALLQLGYGFGNFHQVNLRRGYFIRDLNSISDFAKSFEYIHQNYTLGNPLIFINRWHGMTAQSVGVFRIINNMVISERPINAICEKLFGSQIIRDRRHCSTLSTGDPFSPRCQDFTVAIVTILLVLLIAVLYRKRRNRLKRLLNRELNIITSLLEIRKHTASSLDMYLVNRKAIKLLHEIGSGTFGRVHYAELQRPGQSTVVVAAKEPREGIGPTEECEFFHEACVLAPLCHDNIIRLVGICLMNGPPTVLMEHAYYLDLKRYLTERRHLVSGQPNDIDDDRAIEVSEESLTRLACEAAGALTYLATRRLVHRDIRAANCLIDKKRSLKLGDFGMARELDVKAPEYATIRRALFPVLWMAPESLELGVFSFATDIWSLGVLIMEVITLGARPYGDWQPTRVFNYVTAGGFPPLPPDVSKQTSSLLHSCWEASAELRPSASWVHKYLTQNPRALSPALLKPYPPDPPNVYIE